jgi:hypothetical protein
LRVSIERDALETALDDATDKGQIFCTVEQLYYAYLRRQGDEAVMRSAPIGAVVWLAAFALMIFALDTLSEKLAACAVAGGVHFIAWSVYKWLLHPVGSSDFAQSLAACDDLPSYRSMILHRPTLETEASAYPIRWADAYDQVMFVSDDIMVDFFAINGFATENKTLVVSLNGYPQSCQEHLVDILHRSDRQPVLVLHDAVKGSGRLVNKLRQLPAVQESGLGIMDMGMVPSDLKVSRIPRAWRRSGSMHAYPPGPLLLDLTTAITHDHSLKTLREHREMLAMHQER